MKKLIIRPEIRKLITELKKKFKKQQDWTVAIDAGDSDEWRAFVNEFIMALNIVARADCSVDVILFNGNAIEGLETLPILQSTCNSFIRLCKKTSVLGLNHVIEHQITTKAGGLMVLIHEDYSISDEQEKQIRAMREELAEMTKQLVWLPMGSSKAWHTYLRKQFKPVLKNIDIIYVPFVSTSKASTQSRVKDGTFTKPKVETSARAKVKKTSVKKVEKKKVVVPVVVSEKEKLEKREYEDRGVEIKYKLWKMIKDEIFASKLTSWTVLIDVSKDMQNETTREFAIGLIRKISASLKLQGIKMFCVFVSDELEEYFVSGVAVSRIGQKLFNVKPGALRDLEAGFKIHLNNNTEGLLVYTGKPINELDELYLAGTKHVLILNEVGECSLLQQVTTLETIARSGIRTAGILIDPDFTDTDYVAPLVVTAKPKSMIEKPKLVKVEKDVEDSKGNYIMLVSDIRRNPPVQVNLFAGKTKSAARKRFEIECYDRRPDWAVLMTEDGEKILFKFKMEARIIDE